MFEHVSLDLGGRKLSFETGKMARQAHGAIVARYGDTVVLATACMDTGASDGKYLRIAGIPSYGVPGVFGDVDDDRAHGKDERIGVKDFYDGVDFYYEFIKSLAGGQ